MKNKFLVAVTIPAATILFLNFAAVRANAQTQEQQDSPKVSEGEAKAITAFNAAADAAAKLKVAEDFVKNYPKSSMLPQMTRKVAIEISSVKDPTQKLALAERFEKAFSDSQALAIVQSSRLEALITLKQIDDAFTLAASLLAKNPEDLLTLMQAAFAGTEEAKRGNGKYLQSSLQYGSKAIEIIEAGKKPANLDDASWTSQKALLPQLYQQTGILAMVNKNPEEAKTRIGKAIALNPQEPTSHAMLAFIINNEYVQLATEYKAMPEGKEKADRLVKLEAMIDSIIDSFAHAVALATGKPEHQGLLQQVMPDLTSYYKYRHNQSVEGLQQLIDKYKVAPAAKP